MRKFISLLAVAVGLLMFGCSAAQRANDFYDGYVMRKPDGTIYAAKPGFKDRTGCIKEAKKETGSSWAGTSSSSLCSENQDCRTAYDKCMKSRGYVIK